MRTEKNGVVYFVFEFNYDDEEFRVVAERGGDDVTIEKKELDSLNEPYWRRVFLRTQDERSTKGGLLPMAVLAMLAELNPPPCFNCGRERPCACNSAPPLV